MYVLSVLKNHIRIHSIQGKQTIGSQEVFCNCQHVAIENPKEI